MRLRFSLIRRASSRRAFYEQLGAQARQLGLDIVSVHPYTSLMEGLLLFSDYQRRTEDGLMQYQRYLECAAALGARFFTFHGERDMGHADDPARWARKCEVYRRLCGLAASCGVTLAQEKCGVVPFARPRIPERPVPRRSRAAVHTLDINRRTAPAVTRGNSSMQWGNGW